MSVRSFLAIRTARACLKAGDFSRLKTRSLERMEAALRKASDRAPTGMRKTELRALWNEAYMARLRRGHV